MVTVEPVPVLPPLDGDAGVELPPPQEAVAVAIAAATTARFTIHHPRLTIFVIKKTSLKY
jgi:hypothetical protein